MSMRIEGRVSREEVQEISRGNFPKTTADLEPMTDGRFKYLFIQSAEDMAEVQKWGRERKMILNELSKAGPMTLIEFKSSPTP